MSVEIVDVMGTDLSVVNAARVSFDKASEWKVEVTGDINHGFPDVNFTLSDRDRKLIKYLAEHNHWSPFSHPQISLRIKMPIFIARQWFKHIVGFSRNEVSRRYVDNAPEFFEPKEWRKRADNKKQGSSDEVLNLDAYDEAGYPISVCQDMQYFPYMSLEQQDYELRRLSIDHYEALIHAGVCPEQARMVLPQSMYTEFIETGSLAAYARLYNLRSKPDAQKEIQEYALEIGKIVKSYFPVSWEYLTGA